MFIIAKYTETILSRVLYLFTFKMIRIPSKFANKINTYEKMNRVSIYVYIERDELSHIDSQEKKNPQTSQRLHK